MSDDLRTLARAMAEGGGVMDQETREGALRLEIKNLREALGEAMLDAGRIADTLACVHSALLDLHDRIDLDKSLPIHRKKFAAVWKALGVRSPNRRRPRIEVPDCIAAASTIEYSLTDENRNGYYLEFVSNFTPLFDARCGSSVCPPDSAHEGDSKR